MNFTQQSSPNIPTWNAKLWIYNKDASKFIYPEQTDYFNVTNKSGVGIAISGGGNRSYSASIGYVRALLNIKIGHGKNAFENAQYLSSISGGSWFSGTLLFALGRKLDPLTIGELLGVNTPPEFITYENLKTINNYDNFMGKRASEKDVVLLMLEAKEKILQILDFGGITQ